MSSEIPDPPSRMKWLRRRHGAMRTPRAIIDTQVRLATGARIEALRRLLIGEDNEVYDATTAGGGRLIVRISHGEDPRFEAERWALDAARAVGVPTPVVLHQRRVAVNDEKTVTFCVEERLPGVALDVLLDQGRRPERAIGRLGELLAAIHGVSVDGFGYLRPDGRGWPITFESIMLDLIPLRVRVLDAARHWGIEDRLVDAGLTALSQHAHLYGYDDSRLVHGDFGLDHVLVDGDPGHEYVSGILDMQECSGGHPAADLANWVATCAERIPLATLLASYPGGMELAERDETLIALMIVRRSLWMLIVDQDHGHPGRADEHIHHLTRALRASGSTA
ncbi:aminoglycoside phosphotransferase family protein [Streptosporangiaceae bacterium NEAU-GS5]|nr:aminoglycoside phosphotransferase family protein [Streptosporangiaceae bacterium NEAU-GS5]